MENRPGGYNPENEGTVEHGRNVHILLKFMRHGERDPDGLLNDYGRDVTREKAQESGIAYEDFDAVKAEGSPAGPSSDSGMARSVETAHIYGHEIAGRDAYNTRVNEALSYESLANKAPYDHTEIYKANLPANYEDLSDSDKATAAKKAHVAAIKYLTDLNTPEANAYIQECAGALAYVVENYEKMARRLKPESRVLVPAGTHGGVMEFLLKEALVRKDEGGNEVVGFQDLKEIGGPFMPSETFNVNISTDESGVEKQLAVSFDSSERPSDPDMYLDANRVHELSAYYKELHSKTSEEVE